MLCTSFEIAMPTPSSFASLFHLKWVPVSDDTIVHAHVNGKVPSCTNRTRHIFAQIWALLQEEEKDRRIAKV